MLTPLKLGVSLVPSPRLVGNCDNAARRVTHFAMVMDDPAEALTMTSPSAPPIMILPDVKDVITPETRLLTDDPPLHPETLTMLPTVNPAVMNPLPESLNE